MITPDGDIMPLCRYKLDDSYVFQVLWSVCNLHSEGMNFGDFHRQSQYMSSDIQTFSHNREWHTYSNNRYLLIVRIV